MPKKITIEKLAGTVAKGFTEVHKKMDEGFSELRKEVKQNTTSIQFLAGEITSMKTGIENIAMEGKQHQERLNLTETKLEQHDRRIKKVEHAVGLAK